MGKTYRYENFEREFYKDVREKKKAANGVYHRASRRGYVSSVRTQSDFLTKREKDKLNGEVRVSNMYDKYKDLSNLPKKKEMLRMSKENPAELRKMLEVAKNNHTSIAIQKATGIGSGSLYVVYDRIGINYNRGSKATETNKKVVNKKIAEKDGSINKELASKEAVNLDQNEIKTILNNIENRIGDIIDTKTKYDFSISINMEGEKQEIEDRILALSSIMLQGCKYSLVLNIKEV